MAKDPKWAVMVFMGAERVPGDADLLEAASMTSTRCRRSSRVHPTG